MKKIILAASISAVLGSLSFAHAASTGTITFNGLLTATTCNVSIEGQGANAAIGLPTIGTSDLTAAGRTAGRTGFNMSLTDCTGSLTEASAFFAAGTTVDLATGRLKNMSGDAENVELQLRDGSSSTHEVIRAGNTSQVAGTTYVDISSGSATLPYLVEYYATGAATAGTVGSSVVYSLQYQ